MLQLRVSVTGIMKHACCVGICSEATVQFCGTLAHRDRLPCHSLSAYIQITGCFLLCVLIITCQYRANEKFCDDILVLGGL